MSSPPRHGEPVESAEEPPLRQHRSSVVIEGFAEELSPLSRSHTVLSRGSRKHSRVTSLSPPIDEGREAEIVAEAAKLSLPDAVRFLMAEHTAAGGERLNLVRFMETVEHFAERRAADEERAVALRNEAVRQLEAENAASQKKISRLTKAADAAEDAEIRIQKMEKKFEEQRRELYDRVQHLREEKEAAEHEIKGLQRDASVKGIGPSMTPRRSPRSRFRAYLAPAVNIVDAEVVGTAIAEAVRREGRLRRLRVQRVTIPGTVSLVETICNAVPQEPSVRELLAAHGWPLSTFLSRDDYVPSMDMETSAAADAFRAGVAGGMVSLIEARPAENEHMSEELLQQAHWDDPRPPRALVRTVRQILAETLDTPLEEAEDRICWITPASYVPLAELMTENSLQLPPPMRLLVYTRRHIYVLGFTLGEKRQRSDGFYLLATEVCGLRPSARMAPQVEVAIARRDVTALVAPLDAAVILLYTRSRLPAVLELRRAASEGWAGRRRLLLALSIPPVPPRPVDAATDKAGTSPGVGERVIVTSERFFPLVNPGEDPQRVAVLFAVVDSGQYALVAVKLAAPPFWLLPPVTPVAVTMAAVCVTPPRWIRELSEEGRGDVEEPDASERLEPASNWPEQFDHGPILWRRKWVSIVRAGGAALAWSECPLDVAAQVYAPLQYLRALRAVDLPLSAGNDEDQQHMLHVLVVLFHEFSEGEGDPDGADLRKPSQDIVAVLGWRSEEQRDQWFGVMHNERTLATDSAEGPW